MWYAEGRDGFFQLKLFEQCAVTGDVGFTLELTIDKNYKSLLTRGCMQSGGVLLG